MTPNIQHDHITNTGTPIDWGSVEHIVVPSLHADGAPIHVWVGGSPPPTVVVRHSARSHPDSQKEIWTKSSDGDCYYVENALNRPICYVKNRPHRVQLARSFHSLQQVTQVPATSHSVRRQKLVSTTIGTSASAGNRNDKPAPRTTIPPQHDRTREQVLNDIDAFLHPLHAPAVNNRSFVQPTASRQGKKRPRAAGWLSQFFLRRRW